MTEEEKKVVTEQPVVEDTTQAWLDKYNKLKESSVPKEQFQKLLDENKTLIENLGTTTPEVEAVVVRSNDELKKILRAENTSNLEYCEAALELRDNILKETGKDIFVANSSSNTPDAESYASAERVAEVFKECIDLANGDSERFTIELMARTVDVPIPRR